MQNKTKIQIASVGLILLGLYYFYKQKEQKAEITEEDVSANPQIIKNDYDKVLKKGSTGREVEMLQKALKTLVADGNFGNLTEARLKKVMGVTETSINKYNQFIKNKQK
jgi:hypothetical protein